MLSLIMGRGKGIQHETFEGEGALVRTQFALLCI